MAAHIFVLSEDNYQVCVRRGIVGLPEVSPDSKNANNTIDGLISRLSLIKENDYILFYITGKKELRGLWKACGDAFYDETPVWTDKIYPFRYRLSNTEYSFENSLHLHDIFDLQNAGKIWTFALKRASGSNAVFSITDTEFSVILNEYFKINPFSIKRNIIMEPYPVRQPNLFEHLHFTSDQEPKYEYTLMSLLLRDFAQRRHVETFGQYTDFLPYVPTNFQTEMDILLLFGSPNNPKEIVSYDVLELKRDLFDEKALKQLIGYESWFIQKKVHGDLNMVRTTAVAARFDPSVVAYVEKRKQIEDKEIKLLRYDYRDNAVQLIPLCQSNTQQENRS